MEDLFAGISSRWDYPAVHYARYTAILAGAEYDALQIIASEDQLRPLLVSKAQISTAIANFSESIIKGANIQVATAYAGRDVLLWMFPASPERVNDTFLQNLPSGFQPSDHGAAIAIGQAVAAQYIQLRNSDGFDAVDPLESPPSSIGSWEPTPPNYRNWTNIGIATSTPFALLRPTAFRVDAPPARTSDVYTESFNEVKIKGMFAGSSRTSDENDIVSFWTMDEPAARWMRFTRKIVAARASPTGATGIQKDYEEFRLYAMIGAALVDATIANFDSKVFYYTWRPVTAVRKGDFDENPSTVGNTTWASLRNPDASAEYPSATSSLCAAAGKILINHFKADVDISSILIPYCEFHPSATLCSNTSRLLTANRSYSSLSAMVQECARSRVLGGVHFTFSAKAAVEQSYKVADFVFTNKFDVGTATPANTNPTGLTGAGQIDQGGLSIPASSLLTVVVEFRVDHWIDCDGSASRRCTDRNRYACRRSLLANGKSSYSVGGGITELMSRMEIVNKKERILGTFRSSR